MSIIYVLVPLSLVLMGAAVWALFWAVGSGQFDDLERPAHSILGDDEPDANPSVRDSLPPPDGGS